MTRRKWSWLSKRTVLGALLWVGVLWGPGVSAQRPVDTEALVVDSDAPTATRHSIGERLKYGFKFELEAEHQSNFDLDREDGEDETSIQPQLSGALWYRLAPKAELFLEVELSRNYRLREHRANTRDIGIDLKEAYVRAHDIFNVLTVQLGRQRFDDEREWFYDEELDGARVTYAFDSASIEAAISQREIVTRDLRRRRRRDAATNYFLTAFIGDDDLMLTPRVVFIDDNSAGGRKLTFFGLEAVGELTSRTDFWFQGAHVRGRESGRMVRGEAFDFGLIHTFKDIPGRPYLSAGFAFATGDKNPTSRTDRAFRQTGLQDNTDRFGGVTSFSYYGEVFEPELSNLAISTLGIGMRPSRRTSIDLILHHYRQHYASDEFRDSNLEEDPAGINRNVGRGLDLVFGYREIEDFDVEVVAGLFWPGRAFDRHRDRAFLLSTEIKYKF